MEGLFGFIVFFLMMVFIIFRQWLIDRQNRKKREEVRRQKSAYQSSKPEPVDPISFHEPHQIKSASLFSSGPVQEVETSSRSRYSCVDNIGGRELIPLLQDHHFSSNLGSLETPECISIRCAVGYKEFSSPIALMPASRIGSLLQSQKNIKDVILLSEILKNPYF